MSFFRPSGTTGNFTFIEDFIGISITFPEPGITLGRVKLLYSNNVANGTVLYISDDVTSEIPVSLH